MKILFVGLSSYYTEGLNYQDNSFCKVFLDEGHEVAYISNPEAYINGGKTYVGESESIVEDGVKLIRVDYKFDRLISKKLKIILMSLNQILSTAMEHSIIIYMK